MVRAGVGVLSQVGDSDFAGRVGALGAADASHSRRRSPPGDNQGVGSVEHREKGGEDLGLAGEEAQPTDHDLVAVARAEAEPPFLRYRGGEGE